jgi:hypothetical protein
MQTATQPQLLEPETPAAGPLVARTESADIMSMIERVATTPGASMDAIERLVALRERMLARDAELAFNAAMSACQKAMEPVNADSWNPSTKSRYASYEALDKALRPIYTANGFGLSFNTTDCPLPDHVRVTCKAAHAGGHAEMYRLDMPSDGKGAKGGDVMTKTHATGSAVAYGMRYLLKMIFNVAVGDADDDGNKAGRTEEKPPAPKGFDAWFSVLLALADEGLPKLEDAWSKSKADYKTFVVNHCRKEWDDAKRKAAVVTRGGRA